MEGGQVEEVGDLEEEVEEAEEEQEAEVVVVVEREDLLVASSVVELSAGFGCGHGLWQI